MPSPPSRRLHRRIATFGALGVAGALAILMFLSLSPDLRGWPSSRGDAVLEATTPSGRNFHVSACLPWTVNLHDPPTRQEYVGSATLEVVSCRSKRSLLHWLGLYAGVLAAVFVASFELNPRPRVKRR